MEILGIIGSAGGMGWGAWIKVVRPMVRKSKARKLAIIEDRKKLDYLVCEMTVDGNGSMKSKVVNLVADMNHLKSTQSEIMDRLFEIDENQKLSMNLQGVRFWISNNEGHWTYASPELCKFLGRSESELLGRNWLQVVAYEDRDRIIGASDFSAENESGFDEIFTVRKSDGLCLKVWAVALPRAGRKIFGGTMGKMTPIEAPHPPQNQIANI